MAETWGSAVGAEVVGGAAAAEAAATGAVEAWLAARKAWVSTWAQETGASLTALESSAAAVRQQISDCKLLKYFFERCKRMFISPVNIGSLRPASVQPRVGL